MSARPYRVLVVEDEALTAQTYVDHLHRLPGFEVAAVAGSLLEARKVTTAGLHADGRFPFDVVLLDMNLPDGHGLDFLQQLRGAGALEGQEQVDAVFRVSRERRAEELPKGLTEGPLREVVGLLGADPGRGHSAAEVGERLGISRVTARRYLEHLERIRRVDRSARHGGRGRPEQEYRWAGRG